MNRKIVVILVLGIVPAAVAATVSGKVVDDRNRPLPGATVWVNIRPDGKTHPKPYTDWTRTGPDGTFAIKGVPAGQFGVCAQIPNSPFVDGCIWEAPHIFTATSTSVVNLESIQLHEGHQFQIKIDDPRGELESLSKANKSPDLHLGVWTSTGTFYPLELRHKDPNGHEYGAIVPYDTPIQMSAGTQKLNLADARGTAINAQQQDFRQTFTIKRGTTPPMMHLQITGVIAESGGGPVTKEK